MPTKFRELEVEKYADLRYANDKRSFVVAISAFVDIDNKQEAISMKVGKVFGVKKYIAGDFYIWDEAHEEWQYKDLSKDKDLSELALDFFETIMNDSIMAIINGIERYYILEEEK